MPKLRSLEMKPRNLAASALVMLFAVGLGFGQTGEAMRATIPYAFTLASQTLPAGTYEMRVTQWGLQLTAAGKTYRTPIITRLGGPNGFLGNGSLVFDKMGDTRILSEVWMPGADGLLVHSTPKNHNHEVLLLSEDSNGNGSTSGKAVYNQTCVRCHGPAGTGDQRADKFFKTNIPRLSSAEVQSKSDAELRQVIMQGGREMAPVEIDEVGFRHRLAPESVDAVIAYLRTLKR